MWSGMCSFHQVRLRLPQLGDIFTSKAMGQLRMAYKPPNPMLPVAHHSPSWPKVLHQHVGICNAQKHMPALARPNALVSVVTPNCPQLDQHWWDATTTQPLELSVLQMLTERPPFSQVMGLLGCCGAGCATHAMSAQAVCSSLSPVRFSQVLAMGLADQVLLPGPACLFMWPSAMLGPMASFQWLPYLR